MVNLANSVENSTHLSFNNPEEFTEFVKNYINPNIAYGGFLNRYGILEVGCHNGYIYWFDDEQNNIMCHRGAGWIFVWRKTINEIVKEKQFEDELNKVING